MKEIVVVVSDTIEDKVLSSCHSLIAAFFPGKKIQAKLNVQEFFRFKLRINHKQAGQQFVYEFNMYDQTKRLASFSYQGLAINELENLTLPGKEPVFQILLKQAIVFFLENHTEERLPWGILTGIRPGKLMQKMFEIGIVETAQTRLLEDIYLVDRDKVILMQAVAKAQKPFLQNMKERADLAALYVSIPFCPSRCYYCSFPSNTSKNSNLKKYMAVLEKELKLAGEVIRDKNLEVNTVYIGGGTPTVLSSEELRNLLKTIMEHVPLQDKLEYTVEAGRPDTIGEEKLLMLERYGVNRISINPQSMQDYTLQSIGRRHTVADIYKCYELARQNRDWVINMDLILGLPGEGFKEIKDTLNKVIELSPDNITVHSLALKRGSTAWAENYASDSLKYWFGIQKYVHERIRSVGLMPYYFYRQKYSAGNLENVGYALPGKECHYNIAIIEERQNIFGVGAGSVNKILNHKKDNHKKDNHKNIYHPQDINTYMRGYEDVHFTIRQALQE